MTIRRRLVRCVPKETTDQVELWWDQACALHPRWEHLTLRDPLDPSDFPLTSEYWGHCKNGAQLAGLVRLETIIGSGVYIDSDIEVLRPLDDLLNHHAFAAYEDAEIVPDAMFGAEANHPAILACLELAIERINSDSIDWRTGNGAWSTGPGVFTTVLPGRADVTLLDRDSFYPYGYWEKHRASEDFSLNPNTYAVHRWAASWL